MADFSKKHSTAQTILNITWGLLSLILLLTVLYFVWDQETDENNRMLQNESDNIGRHLDQLIDRVTDTVLAAQIESNQFSRCQGEFLDIIQDLVTTEHEISGIVVRDQKTNLSCGTLAHPLSNLKFGKDSPYLVGPFKLPPNNLATFIVKQQLSHYQIEIYLYYRDISAILGKATSAQHVILNDKNKNEILLHLKKNVQKKTWEEYNAPKEKRTVESQAIPPFVITPLSILENFQIVLRGNPTAMQIQTYYHEALALGLILLFSFFVYFNLRRMVKKHFSLHRTIQQAIKNHEFFPVYQPILDLKNDLCTGAEILLRWQTEDNELIMPDFFVEDAEQSGQIVPITLQILEKAFQECKHILDTNAHFHLGLNLSASHFTHATFFDDLNRLLNTYRINQKQLLLELTERDLLQQNDTQLIDKMNELRQGGFSLAVDDFGTGHASISYLQHFPFNYLKIDKLFIQAIGTGAITESLNQSIIHMAQNLELQIIAEGVETIEQVTFLKEHEVYLMQGWYFSKAKDVSVLERFIRKEKL